MELDGLNSNHKPTDDATPLATHDNTSTNVDQVVPAPKSMVSQVLKSNLQATSSTDFTKLGKVQ
jgi:hypothetical protein